MDTTAPDRQALTDWYRRHRLRSRQLFKLVKPEARYSRPIALRDPIWTESSYKFEPEGIHKLVEPAGFVARHQWIDEPARFALTLFEAV